jgi:hypothetical protein
MGGIIESNASGIKIIMNKIWNIKNKNIKFPKKLLKCIHSCTRHKLAKLHFLGGEHFVLTVNCYLMIIEQVKMKLNWFLVLNSTS